MQSCNCLLLLIKFLSFVGIEHACRGVLLLSADATEQYLWKDVPDNTAAVQASRCDPVVHTFKYLICVAECK